MTRHGHLGQLSFVRCLRDFVNTSSGQNLKLSQTNEMDVFVKIVYSIAVNYVLQKNTIWLAKNWMSATTFSQQDAFYFWNNPWKDIKKSSLNEVLIYMIKYKYKDSQVSSSETKISEDIHVPGEIILLCI